MPCPGGCRTWQPLPWRWMSGPAARRCAQGGLRCCGFFPWRVRTPVAMDAGQAEAAAAWRGLLQHDISVLAVLQAQLQGLLTRYLLE